MLTSLTIENLKAFGDLQHIPLGPLTLIYGPNSAGKTSLVQALLLLKQSLDSDDPDRPPLLIRGPLVDLGGFPLLIHGHDLEKELRVGASFNIPSGSHARSYALRNAPSGERSIEATFGWNKISREIRQSQASIRLENGFDACFRPIYRSTEADPVTTLSSRRNRTFQLEDSSRSSIASWLEAELQKDGSWRRLMGRTRPGSPQPNLEVDELLLQLRGKRNQLTFGDAGLSPSYVNIPRPNDISTRAPQEATAGEELWDLTASATNAGLTSTFASLAYIGPLRQAPKRFNLHAGTGRSTVGLSGEHTLEVLAKHPEVLDRANDWMERLEIPYRLEVKNYSVEEVAQTVGDFVALVLQDTRSGVHVAANDVGFGLSQLLPILVQSLLGRDGALLIEQPEIHVHPGLQGRIADLLLEASSSPTNNQIIAETHSENLILRVQRRIRAGFPSNHVVVLYVEPLPTGTSVVHHLRMDDNGEFVDEWPQGFFEDRISDLFDED